MGKEILGLLAGIMLGLVIEMFIHDVVPNCSKNRVIISTHKIKPTLVITTTEVKSDTLYIYKINNDK